MSAAAHSADVGTRTTRPSLGELVATFFHIGCISFGGAAGQIAMMHRMIVDEKGWISERDYIAGLNFCTLLPGPEAQQLATYIGWRLHGLAGGVVAGALFVLPGAALILVLAQLYVLGTGIPAVEGLLLGIKAAVVAIIIEAVLKIGRRALKSVALKLVAIAAFLAMTVLAAPFPLVIVAAALAGLAIGWKGAPAAATAPAAQAIAFPVRPALICLVLWWLPVGLAALALGAGHLLVEIGLFFSKLAVITFGGAYALLAYLADEAVGRGWVDVRQMMDALGFAETTPGPTILVNPFIAFIAGAKQAGWLAWAAGLMALWTTFAPSFLWIFAGAPYLDRINASRALSSILAGISAAVVGIIATVGAKFALLFIFPQAKQIIAGPVEILLPAGAPHYSAAALASLALALVFLLHWPLLRMLGLLALAGALLGVAGL